VKFSDLKLRVRALFMPGQVDRELDDELAFHIGVVTGGGLAAVTAIVLLSTPAAETIGTLVRASDPQAEVEEAVATTDSADTRH
jgi:hypothetical protein